jgi:putative hydrolase of the HAD superfamily
MPAIQAVLFDLGGTLLHYDQPPEYSFEALNALGLRAFMKAASEAGAKIADPDLTLRAISRVAAAMEAKAARTMHASTAENAIREGLEAVGIQLRPKPWEAGLAAYYATISATVTSVAGDVPAILAQLTAQGRTLGLVSNTLWSPQMHDADLARFGLLEYLPVRVYSYDAGVVKPHVSIYRQALDRLDVAPAEAVFVGDRLAVDVAGPQKIGMRAVLVATPFRTEENPEIEPDARINALSELPDLLETWDRQIESNQPQA